MRILIPIEIRHLEVDKHLDGKEDTDEPPIAIRHLKVDRHIIDKGY